ncbi:MAG: pyruvate dehydrogenase (acetyl-transferring), homodimeric type [Pseudomonadota bacterium]|nr:pyruvate dehydrogenase (acetyl-transferring), homodimeric type [Pseudomonadota bacterium]
MKGKLEPRELEEWLLATETLLEEKGAEYTQSLLHTISSSVLGERQVPTMAYWNTPTQQFPVNLSQVKRASELVRWNAMTMVVKAADYGSELGGHISSYASSSILYEVGFNYFFRSHEKGNGDLVLFQGHSSPGMYARSFLLDQLSEEKLKYFRRESQGKGVSSYPHPWLMPDYWQFPTVSMGLGPLQGIYSAKLIKYLEHRGLLERQDRHVWVFCGDGEMDEVESIGALGVASREKLDNLIFVVNCNLVRLDGPCRGNGQIIQELSRYFQGFGWEVIQVVWSQPWLDLVEKDHSGTLKERLMSLNDGQIQALFVSVESLIAWLREEPVVAKLVADWTPEEFASLIPGGHDIQLVANAFHQATLSQQPCVILVLTEKGYGIPNVAGKNTSHNQKKLTKDQVALYAKFLNIPLESLEFYHPGKEYAGLQFMHQQREQLGGRLPFRHQSGGKLDITELSYFYSVLKPDQQRTFSTTMAFVRVLNLMLRYQPIKERIVPILADEGRTLGMEGLFRQIGIYASEGQQYTPHDRQEVSYYKESQKGQLIQEGINEAGAVSMWLAAATAYSVHQLPLIPIYAFYSMFGFQRVGDLIWAAADSRSRGFLMGATAGRTTLGGEGLQHNDGTSLLVASTIPNCKSYDPCYAYELAVIMHKGMTEMFQDESDVFYYITMMNENYHHLPMPEGVEQGICQGMYCIDAQENTVIDLMASGTILREMQSAATWLREHTGVAMSVWSVTSWSELAREAQYASDNHQSSYIERSMSKDAQLVVAASDYVKALPGLIFEYIPRPFMTLGTDGFGLSDTRHALRDYFGVSAQAIKQAVLWAMVDVSLIDRLEAKRLLAKLQQEDDSQTSGGKK